MNGSAWSWLLVLPAALLAAAALVHLHARRLIGLPHEAISRWKRISTFGKIIICAFVMRFTYTGATKLLRNPPPQSPSPAVAVVQPDAGDLDAVFDVTNLCFTAIERGTNSTVLLFAWSTDDRPPLDRVGLFSALELPGPWTHLFDIDISACASNALVEVTDAEITTNSPSAAFFRAYALDAVSGDTDGDGMPDTWEVLWGFDPFVDDGDEDADEDGLTNFEECMNFTHPRSADGDGDGLTDVQELGRIRAAAVSAWIDFPEGDGDDVTDLFSSADASLASIPIYTPMFVQGTAVTRLLIDVNGIVHLTTDEDAAGIGSLNSNTRGFEMNLFPSFMVAPLWQNLYLASHEPATRVSVHFADFDGRGHLVVQYLNACPYMNRLRQGVTNAVSWQVAIPTGVVDRVKISYSGLVGDGLDGRDARVGASGNSAFHEYGAFQEGVICDGLTLDVDVGTGTFAVWWDTDGDELPDGWEVEYGLNPLSDTGNDGADGDPDHDGVTNAQELAADANPRNIDSDGDGYSDGLEIAQGYDPADANDNAASGSRELVRFYFGDPSGSRSEMYRLELTPVPGSGPGRKPATASRVNSDFGECETFVIPLKIGWAYEVRLYWEGSSYEYSPDYDYVLSFPIGDYPPLNVVLDDPQGLFCENFLSTSFFAEGKVATISVIKADVFVCSPNDPDWSELEKKRVVLDDEELRVKIKISPQMWSIEDCVRMFDSSVLKVKTSGTLPQGADVSIYDATLDNSEVGRTELRFSFTRAQLKSLGLVPTQDDDDVTEMSVYDVGTPAGIEGSDLSDANAFLALGAVRRGMATGESMSSLDSTPPVSELSESFLKAAGCEIITAEYGVAAICRAVSDRRQIMNQADYFYYSGHGYHKSALLDNYPPSSFAERWNKDLNCLVISGCSILDINDYNNNFAASPEEHTASPGKLWAEVGPSIMLGYNYNAPQDTSGAPVDILNRWLRLRPLYEDVRAWMLANDNRNGRNACTIQRINDLDVQYSYFKREKGYLRNTYSLTNVIERVSR